jgi:A/G-specific adenine glycosylase
MMRTARNTQLAALLAWYARNGRHALPWRKTRDPYAIYVSEAMLQQTQVDRVIPFYDRWLKRFPTWHALARAKTDALIRAWAGLGYNRRALYAREAARIVVTQGVPKTIDGWRDLPGMGPYASAAVFSFTKRKFVPAIDTNVRRVIGRIFLGIPYPTTRDDNRVRGALTDRGIGHGALGIGKDRNPTHHLTYALMDFGSAVCTSKNPRCATCPLRGGCKSKAYFQNHPTRTGEARPRPYERHHLNKRHPDRIYRGRILALVRDRRRVIEKTIGPRIDETFHFARDKEWMRAMIDRLIRDGFLARKNSVITIART